MFRMCGNTVQLIRYIVRWQEIRPVFDMEGKEETTVERSENCISAQHKDEVLKRLKSKTKVSGVTVEEIGQAGNEWIDGMEFLDYDEAKAALEAGGDAYLKNKPLTVEEQLAGLTFALVESGVL